MMRTIRASRAAIRRAFTLIELMVAVGAVALIAVGLAAVFGSISDTVTAGRSVSGFTAYAAMVERQLRDDIGHMSRDGFLLIVNQKAEEGEDVALYAGQVRSRSGPPLPHQQRPRRIDEMVFFREGEFTSGREPLGAGYTAEAGSAMIYYGHGARQPVDEQVNSVYIFPRADDDNANTGPLGNPDPLVGNLPNPNRYASQWGLLRLQVALAGADGSLRDRPSLFGLPPAMRSDQDTQLAGQPAARSVFESLGDIPPPPPTAGGPIGTATGTVRSAAIPGETPATHPRFTSGLVDLATTDLAEVRRIVMSSPVSGPGQVQLPGAITALPTGDYAGIVAPFFLQQAWMLDALPAPSVGFTANAPGSGPTPWTAPTPYPPDWAPAPDGVRIRYEPAPPAYLEPMDLQPLARAVRLADQMALTSPLLVPRCTELIIEWSFGKVAEDGSLIWHGIERGVDIDRDGSDDIIAARPYLDQPYSSSEDQRFLLPYRLRHPAPAGIQGFADPGDLFGSYPVSAQLIHGFEDPKHEQTFPSGAPTDDGVLVSFFGFLDPTFNPQNPGLPSGAAMHPVGDLLTQLSASSLPASASDSIPWAWPELIRVTMSLADPAEPTIEQTFQFVFKAPGNPDP